MDFEKNSQLYASPNLTEGVDYARRHRRHERVDDSLARAGELPKTVILAPHGGGIEPGTSELCLAVAGYHPANLPMVPPAGPSGSAAWTATPGPPPTPGAAVAAAAAPPTW